jgi:hypothetical protein
MTGRSSEATDGCPAIINSRYGGLNPKFAGFRCKKRSKVDFRPNRLILFLICPEMIIFAPINWQEDEKKFILLSIPYIIYLCISCLQKRKKYGRSSCITKYEQGRPVCATFAVGTHIQYFGREFANVASRRR